MLTPSLDEAVAQFGKDASVAVWRDIPADLLTPLAAYWKLAHDEPHSFLLESVTGGEQLARYSFLGVRPYSLIVSKNDRIQIDGKGRALVKGEDPLRIVSAALAERSVVHVDGMPRFCGGAVGAIGYDYVRHIERLPDENPDDLQLADIAMMLCETVVAFDHARGVARVICLTEVSEAGYERARRELDRVETRLQEELPPLPPEGDSLSEPAINMKQAEFEEIVRRCKEYIVRGDGIQVVPSLRIEQEVSAHPVAIYRALRSLNPSPYMFLLRFGDFDVVGASPETLVGLEDGIAHVRPIAGTRPRGETMIQDRELAEELLADEKERAEHIMLVDLGRNDLGKVSDYGSVKVEDLMVVERYSHVMHIVSSVTGRLREDQDAVDLVRSCFPAGTLSGAPKVRAMQIIDEMESTRRGLYGGAVGYLSANGDLDLAIAIRTIVLKGGKAYVQAGAGIVYDSVPATEYQECLNKAQAPLRALQLAHGRL